jgi:hypothetical protein
MEARASRRAFVQHPIQTYERRIRSLPAARAFAGEAHKLRPAAQHDPATASTAGAMPRKVHRLKTRAHR